MIQTRNQTRFMLPTFALACVMAACVLLVPDLARAQCTYLTNQCWSPSGTTDIYNTNYNLATSRIGFGTNAPAFRFDFVFSDTGNNVSSQFRILNKDAGSNTGLGLLFAIGPSAGLSGAITSQLNQLAGPGNADLYFRTEAGGQLQDRLHILYNGNVGIGTITPTVTLEVNGTVKGTNIQAQYQDLAEWVATSHVLLPGTVVVVDSEQPGHVTFAETAYDTRVAGVVSSQPGLVLGQAGEGRAMIATTGRVKVKVDASRAPVRVGDLLVTSDREGFAMRSEPVDVAGVRMHRPGTLIGKALEPLENGEGEILVLLSLQ